LKRLASAPREGCWHGLGAALVSVAVKSHDVCNSVTSRLID